MSKRDDHSEDDYIKYVLQYIRNPSQHKDDWLESFDHIKPAAAIEDWQALAYLILSKSDKDYIPEDLIRYVRNMICHGLDRQVHEVEYVARRIEAKLRIHMPPGFRLDRLLQILVSRKSYERVYYEIIADMRQEYVAALHAGRHTKARWIVVRCYGSVFWAWLIQVPSGIISEVLKKLSGS